MTDASGYGELTLGGKTLVFKFGALAYKLLSSYRNMDLYELGLLLQKDIFAIVELAYFAHVAHERINGRTTDVTMDWFIDVVGDSKEALPMFSEIMKSARLWGYTADEFDQSKKKD